MRNDKILTDEQIVELTGQLRSWAGRVRGRPVSELVNADFEQLERPDGVGLLIAALDVPALRDRARESLGRALRSLDAAALARLGPEERIALRRSLAQAKPHYHADFLVAAADTLLHLGDTEAIPSLEQLVEHSTIRRIPATATGYREPPKTTWTFKGTYDEEHDMRRVRTAAHVACERLKLLAEKMALGASLLHPSSAPEQEQLLRPASTSHSEPDQLLRPEPDPTQSD